MLKINQLDAMGPHEWGTRRGWRVLLDYNQIELNAGSYASPALRSVFAGKQRVRELEDGVVPQRTCMRRAFSPLTLFLPCT